MYGANIRKIIKSLKSNCVWTTCKLSFTASSRDCKDCPLKELRHDLSIEKKHEYTMGLSDEEIEHILAQHECCYEKRVSDLNQW